MHPVLAAIAEDAVAAHSSVTDGPCRAGLGQILDRATCIRMWSFSISNNAMISRTSIFLKFCPGIVLVGWDSHTENSHEMPIIFSLKNNK